MGNTIIDDLLCCRDISVVLRKRPEGRQYVESYLLKNLVLSNGQFWGKFANVHPPSGHEQISQFNMMSYAYNNFSPVVCTMSLSDRMERYYSSDAYSQVHFRANGHYKKIWTGPADGNISDILESVNSGLKMKAIIESTDGYIYVMPLHTFEVYENDNKFVAETEFDGYPERFRYFKDVEMMGQRFTDFTRETPEIIYAQTGYEFQKPYFLTSFLIKNNSILHRIYDKDNRLHLVDFSFKKVEIWAESN